MPLSTILKKTIVHASRNSTVLQAAQTMEANNVGAIIVVDDAKPVGLITDRDIVLRCVSRALDPLTTSVEQIMSKGVETVTVDQGIYDVAKKMRQAQVRRIVVVDHNGKVRGLLSFDDVFDLLGEELAHLREAIAPEKPKIVEQAA